MWISFKYLSYYLQPGDGGPLIEIIDACFGFVRKKSAGTSVSRPKFETRMFADQDDVDNFVLQHSKEINKSENVCKTPLLQF